MIAETINPAKITYSTKSISLRAAALTAGLGLLIMVIVAPFAEVFAFPKLVVSNNIEETVENITLKKGLFVSMIFGYLVTFICDIVVAWALYILLRPVNESLSLLTALFRWVYTVIALMALLNLVTVYRMLDSTGYSTGLEPGQMNTQIMLLLKSFRSNWYFGLIFFSIHLGLLGYLVMKASYIPGILGVFLVITGLGYLLTNIRPYLFPAINVDFAQYTYYGELFFMLWLLIRGWKVKEPLIRS